MRDDSELSVMVLESIEPPDGKPFKVGGVCACLVDGCCDSTIIAPGPGAPIELALKEGADEEEAGPKG